MSGYDPMGIVIVSLLQHAYGLEIPKLRGLMESVIILISVAIEDRR